MTQDFSKPPSRSLSIRPFTVEVPDTTLDQLRTLINLSKIGTETWENTQSHFGTTHKWLSDARAAWLDPSIFSWRSQEERINSLPNFSLTVPLSTLDSKWKEGVEYNLHHLALFSNRTDALPILLLHGFPGSFLEYVPLLESLKKKYTPDTLPYHFILPSLPGYGFSAFSASTEPKAFVNTEFDYRDGASILNRLMAELGFGDKYVVHGGDVGTLFARYLAEEFDGCKAFHMNGIFGTKQPVAPEMEGYTEQDKMRIAKAGEFFATGFGYAMMHMTKPGTIGLTISSSPLALLAWIGEKLCDWVQDALPIETILANVTLYWITDTYPRCIYSNRFPPILPFPENKPFGVSNFPCELVAAPRAWVEKTFPNVVFYKDYEKGGHFSAWEVPEAALSGIEEFMDKVKNFL
ncbi:Epoxide hydrolase 1 [Colletotrichum chlorophyti]|uniref:Epoxide hydrolase 1 n=1 Tax=Colletotrichum chlorophyti TaxID=708187 RepID=A0A1Q8S5P1_9PEZI|nr:Epoxide hydrolase 1 [Colletotrichum chlorophyti]